MKGPGTHAGQEAWERQPAKPPETPWLEWRDWGSRTLPQYKLLAGTGPGPDPRRPGCAHQTWGFRKFPYSTLQTVQLQYSLGRSALKLNYDGEFRRRELEDLPRPRRAGLAAREPQLLRPGQRALQHAARGPGRGLLRRRLGRYRFTPWSRWALSRTFEVYAGPEVKWTQTPPDQSGYLGAEQPVRHGGLRPGRARAGASTSTRAGTGWPGTVGDQFRADGKPALSGVRFKAEGFYYAEAWDATDAFGGVDGELRGYLVGKRAMLAARVGGRQVWGEYPWFEAAFVGGSRNLRGYRKNRYGGDPRCTGASRRRLWLFKGR